MVGYEGGSVSFISDNRHRQISAAICVAAALALGRAIQVGNGTYDLIGLVWLAVGFGMAWLVLVLPAGKPAWGFCVGGVAWELWQLWNDTPLVDAGIPPIYYAIAPPLLTLATVGAMLLKNVGQKLFVPLLIICHFLAGAWLLDHSRKPFIDVYEVTKDACTAFSVGHNPYAINVPDIYRDHPDWERKFYPAEFLAQGPIKLNYSYMPLSFAFAYGGYALGGDFRLGNLLALSAAAGLIAFSSNDRLATGAACLLLLTPRVFHLIQYGWTEPIVILMLAGSLFCAVREIRALPWVLGLLFVSKQYMFLAAPAALLLLPGPWSWKSIVPFFLKSALAGAIVTLPLALWDCGAFLHTVVELPLKSPFREDSLSFSAAVYHSIHLIPPGYIGFAAAIAAALIAVWRLPRTAAGFAVAIALIYLSLFVAAKQAFGNYYFVPISALCCAVAASSSRPKAT